MTKTRQDIWNELAARNVPAAMDFCDNCGSLNLCAEYAPTGEKYCGDCHVAAAEWNERHADDDTEGGR